jgi:hypothetical protein
VAAHIAARDERWRTQHGAAGESYLVDVLGDRAARYAAHLERMALEPDITAWALQMAARWGSYVQVHHYVADSWLIALLILRYGEEPEAARSTDPDFSGWPLAFTADDRARAVELLHGTRWPDAFTLLSPRSTV